MARTYTRTLTEQQMQVLADLLASAQEAAEDSGEVEEVTKLKEVCQALGIAPNE